MTLIKMEDKEQNVDYIIGRMLDRVKRTGTSSEETGSPIRWSDNTSYKGFAVTIASDGAKYVAMASELEPIIKGSEINLQSAPRESPRSAGRELFSYIDKIRK